MKHCTGGSDGKGCETWQWLMSIDPSMADRTTHCLCGAKLKEPKEEPEIPPCPFCGGKMDTMKSLAGHEFYICLNIECHYQANALAQHLEICAALKAYRENTVTCVNCGDIIPFRQRSCGGVEITHRAKNPTIQKIVDAEKMRSDAISVIMNYISSIYEKKTG